jgi:threonine synthase
VGSGDGVYGIWKGFRELASARAIPRTPRMIACQAAGADSTVRAFRGRSRRHRPLEETRTVALSIAEKITGDHALRAVYESDGEARSASDEEILAATHRLARMGFALEPASAAALACAEQAIDDSPGETWVLIGTGAAVKWPL